MLCDKVDLARDEFAIKVQFSDADNLHCVVCLSSDSGLRLANELCYVSLFYSLSSSAQKCYVFLRGTCRCKVVVRTTFWLEIV